LDDRELVAIAEAGGVIQVVAFAPYLVPLSQEMMGSLGRLWREYGLKEPTSLSNALSINDAETKDWSPETFDKFLHEFHVVLELDKPVATVQHLVDAIEHTIRVAGIDHVGISSDFNHSGGVIGWMHAGETLNVTAELLQRGHSETDIGKLWGQNYLRLWREVKALASA
jgi:microsomal dipeptidase-like Zn-dependent dipeptidase